MKLFYPHYLYVSPSEVYCLWLYLKDGIPKRERERERERETETETDTETDRQTDRQRHRERQRQTDRQTDRQRYRETDRDRQRQRQRERSFEPFMCFSPGASLPLASSKTHSASRPRRQRSTR